MCVYVLNLSKTEANVIFSEAWLTLSAFCAKTLYTFPFIIVLIPTYSVW